MDKKKPNPPKFSLGSFKTAIQNDLKTSYIGKNPSIAGNILTGQKWNANTKWGQPAEVKKKPFQLSEVKMPKSVSPTPKKVNAPKIATSITPAPVNTKTQVLGIRVTKSSPSQKPRAATPTPTPNPKDSWNNMADMVIREGNKRGYHGETLARQKANESGFGTSQYAKERNNYGGMGAYDSNPDNAFSYDTPEEYLMGKGKRGEPSYFDLIEKDPRYKEAYKHRANPKRYLEELKKAGYASNPNYVDDVLNTRIKK